MLLLLWHSTEMEDRYTLGDEVPTWAGFYPIRYSLGAVRACTSMVVGCYSSVVVVSIQVVLQVLCYRAICTIFAGLICFAMG